MNRRKARLALTLLAFGVASSGVVFGSYAAWTDQTTNTGNSVTAGTLAMTNSKNASAVFTSATDIKPGDTNFGTVTITNSGSLPMSVTLTQDTMTNGFTVNMMKLKIHDDTRNWCYWPATGAGACATFADWDATGTVNALAIANTAGGAMWPASQAHTFTVTWELDSTSPNADQGKSASFRLVWNGSS